MDSIEHSGAYPQEYERPRDTLDGEIEALDHSHAQVMSLSRAMYAKFTPESAKNLAQAGTEQSNDFRTFVVNEIQKRAQDRSESIRVIASLYTGHVDTLLAEYHQLTGCQEFVSDETHASMVAGIQEIDQDYEGDDDALIEAIAGSYDEVVNAVINHLASHANEKSQQPSRMKNVGKHALRVAEIAAGVAIGMTAAIAAARRMK